MSCRNNNNKKDFYSSTFIQETLITGENDVNLLTLEPKTVNNDDIFLTDKGSLRICHN